VRNLSFNLFDDGVPQTGRILLFFRYETPAEIVRSGMLNYDVAARRFVGPVKNADLLAAAERFLLDQGLLSGAAASPALPAGKLAAVAS
jgi:hypothetical protein